MANCRFSFLQNQNKSQYPGPFTYKPKKNKFLRQWKLSLHWTPSIKSHKILICFIKCFRNYIQILNYMVSLKINCCQKHIKLFLKECRLRKPHVPLRKVQPGTKTLSKSFLIHYFAMSHKTVQIAYLYIFMSFFSQ